MKIMKMLLCAALVLVFAACNNSGYNAKTCKELCDKIEKGETLSDKEVSEMIDQWVAIMNVYFEKIKATGYDKEKIAKWESSEEWTEMGNYGNIFNRYSILNKLSEENEKKLQEASQKLSTEMMEMQKEAMEKMKKESPQK